jgi:hypothetical protein
MKVKFTIELEKSLIKKIQLLANSKNKSVSELIEEYFIEILEAKNKISFTSIIEGLPKPLISKKMNMMDLYSFYKMN